MAANYGPRLYAFPVGLFSSRRPEHSEWANEFGFTIEGDYVIVKDAAVAEFIIRLNEEFNTWQTKEKKN